MNILICIYSQCYHNMNIFTHIDKQTYIHKYIHAHTHTYTHTHKTHTHTTQTRTDIYIYII